MVDKDTVCSHSDRYIICINNWTINLFVFRWVKTGVIDMGLFSFTNRVICITVTSHEGNGILNHGNLTVIQQFARAIIKVDLKSSNVIF